MFVIVVEHSPFSREAIGPFPTVEDASAWEDRHLDAPEGAVAHFVSMLAPSDFVERGKCVVKHSE